MLDLAGLGGDPDQWLTLWWAARQFDGAALVITGQERPYRTRAQTACHIIRDVGRIGVVLVAGAPAPKGTPSRWIPTGVGHGQETELPVSTTAWRKFAQILPDYGRRVHWVCAGPLTNLARVLDADESASAGLGLASRCALTLVCERDRADPYLGVDPGAARSVLRRVRDVTVVDPSTLPEEICLTDTSVVGHRLSESELPGTPELRGHVRRWRELEGPDAPLRLATPAALAAAIGLGTTHSRIAVRVDEAGRLVSDPGGRSARLARVEVGALLGTLATALTPAPAPECASFERRKP
ncbi:hypothetical protein [Nocardia puris]|uniref:Inosine-uridine preferring nucleoside hydrolase n=1 Tax=Nocardia puris TaxID=208602 RepID=A0A366D5G6_9NOCA|nr:hypothetical protein [Nocardia puris]RBO85216.1 inosine-uridine preferring nucleoside hydrolase [Nocardia puris]